MYNEEEREVQCPYCGSYVKESDLICGVCQECFESMMDED